MNVDLLLKVIIAYLLGSISGSLLLGKLRGVDIRRSGSGNAGGTNALRTQGWWFALGVVIVDIGKGAVAAGALPQLALFGPVASSLTAGPACAFAAMVGHNYPLFFGFRGGKGAGTYIGSWLVLLPIILLPVLAAFAVMLIATGYVGLSTMTAAIISIPAAWWLTRNSASDALTIFAIAAAALIVFAHRGNIQRLLAGTENRFNKVRLRSWLRRGKR